MVGHAPHSSERAAAASERGWPLTETVATGTPPRTADGVGVVGHAGAVLL
jgi:hypothetical protein